MHPADRVFIDNEMAAAAVAGCLAHAARQRGGGLIADAAELHTLGGGPLWPRSALELERATLPGLARRPGHAGCTVRPVGGLARGMWQITAAPLAPALALVARPVVAMPPLPAPAPLPPRPAAAAVAPALLPAPAPRREPAPRHTFQGASEFAAGVRIPSAAEFERVKREHEAYLVQRAARSVDAARAREHAARVSDLAGTIVQKKRS